MTKSELIEALAASYPQLAVRDMDFAVKTMLVLYGVAEAQAVMFALVVHTIQTALVVLLGAFGWARVNYRKKLS